MSERTREKQPNECRIDGDCTDTRHLSTEQRFAMVRVLYVYCNMSQNRYMQNDVLVPCSYA